MNKKKILFLTGTRADFGKLKTLIQAVELSPHCTSMVFVTGMHTLSRYGYTLEEVFKAGIKNVHVFMNQLHGEPSELILANTISGLSRFVHEYKPDMIVVHGDRIEALAGAIVGALQNMLVAHIEGGELSGTVDELIRHSVSKLSHIHFVANQEAAQRLTQMGEHENTIFVIGSPDIDIMLSSTLPSLGDAKQYYSIDFNEYAIVLFHSVTTELTELNRHVVEFVSALIDSAKKYIVVFPNNDPGCDQILHEYKKLEKLPNFRIFPSIRFEYFLTFLKHAQFIVGNSSAGIREAPIYSVPTINIGTRQNNRFKHVSIIDCDYEKDDILAAIGKLPNLKHIEECHYFGSGDSMNKFISVLESSSVWLTERQKQFCDL